MISSGTNLVMTVIGFAVSTMFIVFVCTRLICARIHLSASRRSFHAHPAAARSDLTVLERGLHGLEPVVVASFATTNFGDRRFLSGQDGQCTVCLAEYQQKDVLRILPYCGHSFHMNCIDIWLKQHSTCPICRISLRDSPDRKYAMQPIVSAPARSVHHLAMSDLDPYRYSYTSEGYSPRTTQNQRMEAAQEHQFISEPSGARDATASLAETNCSNKESLHFESKGKEAESPSNCYQSESIDRNFAV